MHLTLNWVSFPTIHCEVGHRIRYIMLICITGGVNLDHLATVMSAGLLHWEVTFFFFLIVNTKYLMNQEMEIKKEGERERACAAE